MEGRSVKSPPHISDREGELAGVEKLKLIVLKYDTAMGKENDIRKQAEDAAFLPASPKLWLVFLANGIDNQAIPDGNQ